MSIRKLLLTIMVGGFVGCTALMIRPQQFLTTALAGLQSEPNSSQQEASSKAATDDEPDAPERKTKLQEFMRKKLDSSSLILEGLCQQDSELVKQGAMELKEMSSVEKWNILRDAEFRKHTRDFRENVTRLADAADQGDFDKASLAWFDATRACFTCHNHIRAERKSKK